MRGEESILMLCRQEGIARTFANGFGPPRIHPQLQDPNYSLSGKVVEYTRVALASWHVLKADVGNHWRQFMCGGKIPHHGKDF